MYNEKLKKAITDSAYRTQDRFALAVGEDMTVVSRVINGVFPRKLSVERKQVWAYALGVKVEDIFPAETGSEEPEPETVKAAG